MDIHNKKCFIFDLDGTVYMGDQPIQGTIDFIKKKMPDHSIFFMTNNTSKTPEIYVERLKKFDIHIHIDQIISPFIPLFKYLKKNKIRYMYLMANKSVEDYVRKLLPDIDCTDDISKCEVIVMTFDTELNYEKLKTASLLLQNKPSIKYVATHPDNVCPTDKGNIPDVGGFMKIIEMTANRVPDVIFGKPSTELLTSILESYKKEECAIVGDRIYTDKKLADNSGIDFVLVLSGETTIDSVNDLREAPSYIVKDMGIFNT